METLNCRKRAGFSHVELVVVLLVLATLIPPLGGALHKARTRIQLAEARETVVLLIREARSLARAAGSATVVVDAARSEASLLAVEDVPVKTMDLPRQVRVVLRGGRDQARLRFGPLGLGTVASQTLRFESGENNTSLVVSSYGRVDRR